jgi:hypothetical protein
MLVAMMAVQANADTNATDMNADADTGRSGCRAEQTQRKDRYDQFLHDKSLL